MPYISETSPTSMFEHYRAFEKGVAQTLTELRSEFKRLIVADQIAESRVATHFILDWMGEHFRALKRFDISISRSIAPSSADQYTAAVAATLKQFLIASDSNLEVKSEVSLVRKRGSIRPDISIWTPEDEVIAIIECKTNPGYNRSGWQRQYIDRTKKLQRLFPHASSHLAILTSENWDVTKYLDSVHRGRDWVCMSSIWPTQLVSPFEGQTVDPIEPLFLSISSRNRD